MNSNWNQLRRRHKRYQVSWKALLEIDNPDLNDFLIAPVLNISRSGALVFTPTICFRNIHLLSAAQNNELNLIIHSPLSELDSKIHIKRYRWSEEAQGFHLGVEFQDLCEKNQAIADGIIRSISYFKSKSSMPQMDSPHI